MAKQRRGLSLGLWISVMVTISVNFCSSRTTESVPVARSLEDIGNPLIDVDICGRNGKKSYICDPDRVLPVNEADILDLQIEDIRSSTPCPCTKELCQKESLGYWVTVAVINKMKWANSSSSNNIPNNNGDHAWQMDNKLKAARNLASDLLKKWNLGRCQESILILFSRADNVLYTVADVVAERQLTDDLIGEVAMDVRSEFSLNVTTGFHHLLTEYKAVFRGTYNRKTKWDDIPKAYPVLGDSCNSLGVCVYFYSLLTVIVTVLLQL